MTAATRPRDVTSVHIRVPATSANLGPGFDSLGLALGVYDELEVSLTGGDSLEIEVIGVGADVIPRNESNLVYRAFAATFEAFHRPVPAGVRMRAVNEIPQSRGMGSSGAATVAGIMAAKGFLDAETEVTSDDLLRIASTLEGHPDNVAPALFGGMTIAWTTDEGPRFTKLLVHRGVSPLVLVPSGTLSTALARSLQPQSVPAADAIFNLSRAALLVAALSQDPGLLMPATEDRLHQGYRSSAMPESIALIDTLRKEGCAAVVSGAGPSILVLCSDPEQRLEAARIAEERCASPWRAIYPAVDFKGATVVAHSAESPQFDA